MLLLSLLLTGSLAGQPAQTDRAEAERLARSGMYAQALERFRQLASVNPDDLDARVWIGRLHVRMGHAREAEPVFRSVLETAPDRADALIGLGAALTAMGRESEALTVLERAEKLAPNDPDLLTAQGRAHAAAGHGHLAEAYLRRAALLRPTDVDIADAVQSVRRERDHYVSATFVHESFSFDVPDTRLGSFVGNFRAGDMLRVLARVDAQRKFFADEARGGGGLAWQAMPHLTLRLEGLFGSSPAVLPSADVNAGVDLKRHATTWTGGFRFVRFRGADYWVIVPAVSQTIRDRAVISLSYARSLTAFEGFDDLVGNNSGDLRLQIRLTPQLWVGGGYARNVERLDTLSADRIGEFRANTGMASGRFELHSLTTLGVDYDYQRRENGVRMIRVVGTVVQRF
jgi:YaiO family outer membrane protein